MRWLRRIGLVLLVLALILVAWKPSRVALQTAVMLPNLLGAPVRPLDLFSEPPIRSAIPYRTTAGGEEELAELWLPAWASAGRQAGAMLLVLGVNNVGRNHPVVARVADGLARTGVAVLVPDSRVLLEGRLEPGEIDGVVTAFEVLAARPEVDSARVGIVGFSVGGSLALLAAADERIAADVAWVNAFGAYGDAASYLASVSAHAFREEDGAVIPWTPTPLAREVFARFVFDAVTEEGDRERLRAAFEEPLLDGSRPAADRTLRGELEGSDARAIHDLVTAPSLDAAERAVTSLPTVTRRFIEAVSPVDGLEALAADAHLMHELEDHHVPFVESRQLARELEDRGRLVAHTEFRLFDHVQPDDLDVVAATPEIVKLLLHVRALMERSL